MMILRIEIFPYARSPQAACEIESTVATPGIFHKLSFRRHARFNCGSVDFTLCCYRNNGLLCCARSQNVHFFGGIANGTELARLTYFPFVDLGGVRVAERVERRRQSAGRRRSEWMQSRPGANLRQHSRALCGYEQWLAGRPADARTEFGAHGQCFRPSEETQWRRNL